jgi:predicted transcriptional regulator
MALQLPPELEQRVIELARATGRDPNDVYAELVADALDDAERGDSGEGAAIELGDAEVARGEVVEHGEAMRRLDAVLATPDRG